MKTILSSLIFLISFTISAQTEPSNPTYQIVKTNGDVIRGIIISENEQEIKMKTEGGYKVTINTYLISRKTKLKAEHYNEKGEYIGEDKFATRYFISTNGIPMNEGEGYVQANLYGPDVQIGLPYNIGIGFVSTWIGAPMLGTIKKSWELDRNTQFAIGTIVGSGSWLAPSLGAVLPFASVSFGNRKSNLAFSGGYGAVFLGGPAQGTALMTVAGMTQISPKISFVFDSFFIPTGHEDGASGIMIPGIRWHQSEGRAFQFGLVAFMNDGEFLPMAIPMLQWYRSL